MILPAKSLATIKLKSKMMQVVYEGFCSSTVDGTTTSGWESGGLQ
jgi:hypothetical protein